MIKVVCIVRIDVLVGSCLHYWLSVLWRKYCNYKCSIYF